MKKIQFITNNLVVIIAGLAVVSLVVYAQTSWSPPTATPPGDNTPAPVNVGASNQVKLGGLGTGPLAVFGNAIVSGDLDVSGIYKSGGVAGITASCPVGQTVTGLQSRGGIITGGQCGAAGGGGGGPTEIVLAYTYSGWGIATCPAGKTLTGGGCYAGHSNCILQHTYPVSSNQWGCYWKSCGGVTSNAYALCQ